MVLWLGGQTTSGERPEHYVSICDAASVWKFPRMTRSCQPIRSSLSPFVSHQHPS